MYSCAIERAISWSDFVGNVWEAPSPRQCRGEKKRDTCAPQSQYTKFLAFACNSFRSSAKVKEPSSILERMEVKSRSIHVFVSLFSFVTNCLGQRAFVPVTTPMPAEVLARLVVITKLWMLELIEFKVGITSSTLWATASRSTHRHRNRTNFRYFIQKRIATPFTQTDGYSIHL